MRSLFLVAITVVTMAGGNALATDAFFDVFTELSISAPPYPTAPVETQVGRIRGSVITISGANFRTLAAGSGGGGGGGAGGVTLPVSCQAGPAGQDWVAESFFDITYLTDVGGPDFAIDSFFDVFTEFRAPDGSPCQLMPIDDAFPNGDPRRYFEVSFTDSFFDITYEVMFNPREYTIQRCRGEVAPGLRLTSVVVRPAPTCADGSCSAAFHLDIELHADEPSLCCPSTRPVIRLRDTAQAHEAPVAAQDRTWGEVKALFR